MMQADNAHCQQDFRCAPERVENTRAIQSATGWQGTQE
jgi:hypothetical protein